MREGYTIGGEKCCHRDVQKIANSPISWGRENLKRVVGNKTGKAGLIYIIRGFTCYFKN